MTYLKYTPIYYSVSMCLIHTSTPLIYACIENNTTPSASSIKLYALYRLGFAPVIEYYYYTAVTQN